MPRRRKILSPQRAIGLKPLRTPHDPGAAEVEARRERARLRRETQWVGFTRNAAVVAIVGGWLVIGWLPERTDVGSFLVLAGFVLLVTWIRARHALHVYVYGRPAPVVQAEPTPDASHACEHCDARFSTEQELTRHGLKAHIL